MAGEGVNALFRAHMLLLRWGREALARKAAEAGQAFQGDPAAAARDGSEERVTDSIARIPGGASVGNCDSHNPLAAG